MDFESAVAYLDRLPSFEAGVMVEFSLGPVQRAAEIFCPDYKNLPVIHVAGSKGKGSFCLMMADYLRQSGKKVGMFTSPFMLDLRESFWLNGELIEPEEFGRLVGKLAQLQLDLTYFEVMTLIALRFFVEQNVDFAVIEVGLGGRLDSTNIVQPVLTVLTRIEKEHTAILGDTIEQILTEKLGIVKAGVPMVVMKQSEEVEKLLDGREFVMVQQEGALPVMKKCLGLLGLEFDEQYLDQNLRLPGRFDVREIAGSTVVFDMAHTPESMKFLLKQLKEKFGDREVVILFSLMKDKDLDGIYRVLQGNYLEIFVCESHPVRSRTVEQLRAVFDGAREGRFFDVLEGLKKDQVLLVTGSHFLVAQILKSLNQL